MFDKHAAPTATATITWRYNDGGRAEAGFKGDAPGDCVTRAVAIATGRPYREVYDLTNQLALHERPRRKSRSSARTGVHKDTQRRLLDTFGWVWHPTMAIGQGTTVHLRADELPAGRLVVALSKHMAAVIDGVVHDVSDPSREGTRCVYGYWTPPPNGPDSTEPVLLAQVRRAHG